MQLEITLKLLYHDFLNQKMKKHDTFVFFIFEILRFQFNEISKCKPKNRLYKII